MKTENFRRPDLEAVLPFAKVVVDRKDLPNLDLPVERQWLLAQAHPFILKAFEYYLQQSNRRYNAGVSDEGLFFSIDHDYGEVFRLTAHHTPREFQTSPDGVWIPAHPGVHDFPPQANSANTSFALVMQHALKLVEQHGGSEEVVVQHQGTYVEFVEGLYSTITSVWTWNDSQWTITYKPPFHLPAAGYEDLLNNLSDLYNFNGHIQHTRGLEGVGVDRSAYYYDWSKDQLLFWVLEDSNPNILQAYVQSQSNGVASQLRQWAAGEDLRAHIAKCLLNLDQTYTVYHILDVPDQDEVVVKIFHIGDTATGLYLKIKR